MTSAFQTSGLPPRSTVPAAEPPSGIGTVWPLVKSAASAWVDDYAPRMGAALSYYTVFSLAPLLLLVISIAGLVFGEDAARGALFGQLDDLMGASASKAIQELLAGVSKPGTGILGSVIGVVVLLIGATTVFGELQDALDRIWRAPARSKSSGLMSLVRSRFLSFGMILGIAFLLMVSLVMGAAVSALGRWWGGAFGNWEWLLQAVNLLAGFALTTVVFAMIYKLMPRVQVRWHDVWLGAAVTALMFTLGRFLIGLYIGKSDIATGFGAAGSLIIVFVWVYYSAQIFLMGAEFTWVYAKTFGSKREGVAAPEAKAVPQRSESPAPLDAATVTKPVHAPVALSAAAIPARPDLSAPAEALELAPPRAVWAAIGTALALGVALGHLLRRGMTGRGIYR